MKVKPLTISQALREGSDFLGTEIDNAYHEALILLQYATHRTKEYLIAHDEEIIREDCLSRFRHYLERRDHGEPIAYIIEEKEFWSLPFYVTQGVLIPRPETERLVEIALQHVPENELCHVADLGTGSGAIALAIASERPMAQIVATDASESALTIAEQNKINLGISNIQFQNGEWFEAFSQEKFELIVSNPPYVADQDPHLQQGDLRFEPSNALSSGPDGLNDLRKIIQSAPAYLSHDAYVLLEHGYDQADAVIDLFEKSGYSQVQCFRDYGARERATIGHWITS